MMLALSCLVAALGCKMPGTHNLPPAEQMMHPGPGVDGPGPGVLMMGQAGGGGGGPGGFGLSGPASQVAFTGPDGMMVMWDVGCPGSFDSTPLVVPGRYNFPQGALYRLKLTNIPGRPGVELYPTLEVAPAMPRTEAFLAHQAIPVGLTEEDLDQVLTGNFVTKVIYLPDAEFQDLAVAGVETLVSTRLDPGVDPIVEADRRGAIMAILRIGNKDLEVPAMMDASGVIQASATMPMGDAPGAPCTAGCCGPGGCDPNGGMAYGGGGYGGEGGGMDGMMMAGGGGPIPSMISGASAPQWGMPISGTPIGLPGPPHIPLGGPAGLQKHVIKNHTFYHMPKPTRKLAVHVKQKPGFSYPKPANTVHIKEKTVAPPAFFRQPAGNKTMIMGNPPCP
jgi:hypothetical protein